MYYANWHDNIFDEKLWKYLTNILVAAVVSIAAILSSALVGGRVYGPTYYAQYGGNLQPAGKTFKSFHHLLVLDIWNLQNINQFIKTIYFSFEAENRQSGHGDYELYYDHEDKNYYYRQKVNVCYQCFNSIIKQTRLKNF